MSEAGVGSALGRAIRRSLDMAAGLTEIWLFRGGSGWSAEAQSLIDAYQRLVVVHDRIATTLGDTTNPNFDRLEGRMLALERKRIPNETDPRREAEDEVLQLITIAGDLETSLALKDEIAVRPNTTETARALEAREDALIDGSGLPLESHEVLFQRKTEVLESTIGSTVAGSGNPKLAPLQGLPADQYWRFLIDGKAQKDPPDKHFYDRSAGYMAGMMSGLELIVDRIDEPLSTGMIKDLHAAMSRHVTTEIASTFARRDGAPLTRASFQEQGLKKGENGWGVCGECSEDGLRELGEIRTELLGVVPGYFQVNRGTLQVDGRPKEVDVVTAAYLMRGDEVQRNVEALMRSVIEKYTRSVAAAENEDQKLDAIIDCCRGLGQIHPFKDANGRLIMFGVLTKLLLENGMPPAILTDQGLMIGQSREQLRALIKGGQARIDALKPHS